ncbi:MAG: DUF4131 domain-containing protein [Phycisphaerales bacterium]|nr:DUF4131 domain-containing protein [Phycisphaerales bacterium]
MSRRGRPPDTVGRVGVLPILCLAFLLGCVLGVCLVGHRVGIGVAAALLSGGLVAATAAAARRSSRTEASCYLFVGALLVGGGWSLWQLERAQASRIALGSPDRRLAFVTGVVRSACVQGGQDGDLLARYLREFPSKHFDLLVDENRDGGGAVLSGFVRVRLSLDAPEPIPGTTIGVKGWFRAPSGPRNPGGFDQLRWSLDSAYLGSLDAVDGGVVNESVHNSDGGGLSFFIRSSLIRWRASVARSLESALPDWVTGRARSLCLGMVVGLRSEFLPVVAADMSATGLSHLLAISGFNLAVLAASVSGLCRLCRVGRVTTMLSVAATSLLFWISVDAGVSAVRAAACAFVGSIAVGAGRRWSADSILALAALALLIEAPWVAINAGFQLSFVAVLALRYLASPMALAFSSWFDRVGAGCAKATVRGFSACGSFLSPWLAAALCAWAVSTPIVLAHFGTISPAGAPLSVLLSPLAAVIVAAGSASAVLGAIWGPLAAMTASTAALASVLTDWVLVQSLSMPWTSIRVGCVGGWWGTVLLLLMWVTLRSAPRHWRRAAAMMVLWVAALTLVIWSNSRGDSPRLRVTVLDVGNGSCLIVQDGGSCVVFDVGSSSCRSLSSSTLLPALMQMGIGHIDACVVSHPDLDHFLGLPELLDSVTVCELVTTERFLAEAVALPTGPEAAAMTRIRARGLLVSTVSRSCTRRWGNSTWTFLHPTETAHKRANDDSIMVRIDPEGGAGGILLCGDCAHEAIPEVLALPADSLGGIAVLELPHHGSFIEQSVALLNRVRPRFILQSTGESRLSPDRWLALGGESVRLCTARLGAVRVELSPDGDWTAYHWDGAVWVATTASTSEHAQG